MVESRPQAYIPESDEGASFAWSIFPPDVFESAFNIGSQVVTTEITQQAFNDLQILRTNEDLAVFARKLLFIANLDRDIILGRGTVTPEAVNAIDSIAASTSIEAMESVTQMHERVKSMKETTPEYSEVFDRFDDIIQGMISQMAIHAGVDISQAQNKALLRNQFFKLINRNVTIQLRKKLSEL